MVNKYWKEKKVCPACNGTGIQYSDKEGLRVTCPVCLGSGKKWCKNW